jgi:hypothetical protein
VTPWAPRLRAADEPVCWSWPVPPVEDYDAGLARLVAENDQMTGDNRLDLDTIISVIDTPFGLALERWYRFHQGRCAMCGNSWTRCKIVTDHCHATGQVRGDLCGRCNTREGRSTVNPSLLVVRYRLVPPAAILDHHEPYRGSGWRLGVGADAVATVRPGAACGVSDPAPGFPLPSAALPAGARQHRRRGGAPTGHAGRVVADRPVTAGLAGVLWSPHPTAVGAAGGRRSGCCRCACCDANPTESAPWRCHHQAVSDGELVE